MIMVGFGEAAEPMHRDDVSQFRRKRMAQICFVEGTGKLLERVRLALSAVNGQPCCFYGTLPKIHVGREKFTPLTYPILNRLDEIDIGIPLCHLALSVEHTGKSISLQFGDTEDLDVPYGYQYAVTADIV